MMDEDEEIHDEISMMSWMNLWDEEEEDTK